MAAPSKFAHVVYQTHRFEEMIDWYMNVFEAKIRHRDDKLAFLSYDDEHHRMAFLNLGPTENGAAPKKAPGVGVHHVAYTWKDLGELVDTYKRLKDHGVLPAVPIRHGLTLSLYYQDPDGNMMEFQIDLMGMKEADEFMRGPAFAANPVGEPFDPAELAVRYDSGRPVDDLVFRSDQAESHGTAIVRGNGSNGHGTSVSVRGLATPRQTDDGGGAAYLAKVSATLDGIRERAAEVERSGGIPDATIRALTDAGVFRAVQPRRWGGLEIHPAAYWESIVRIGSACGSTGWVAGVVGVHPFHVALFPDEAQREVWGEDPDTRISSTYAPTGSVERVDGGYRLTGRWGFSSGVDYCGWVLLGGIIPDHGNGPEFRTFLVPRRNFKIAHESWKVSGLQGTGSKDVHVDAFVPEHRTHRILDNYNGTDPGRELNSPYFHMPWLSMFAYAIGAPAIGAALGAVDSFVADARSRFGVSIGSAAAQNPSLHLRLAEATTIIADTRARIALTWNEMHSIVQSGSEIPIALRARCRYEATQAIGACLGALLKVFEVGGGGVMSTKKPFQRLLRDLMAMRNHPFGIPEARATAYARCILGAPPEPYSSVNMTASIV